MLRASADKYMDQTNQPFLKKLQNNLETAYATIDEQFDKLELNRSNAASNHIPQFQSGDLVLHYVPKAPRGKMQKLSYLWQGPYMILDVFNNGFNYKVRRVNTHNYQLIHNGADKIVNGNRLKKYYVRSHSTFRTR